MDKSNDTPNESGWDSLPEQLRDDKFLLVMKELSIVHGHVRPLLLVTHAFIEIMVDALITKHLKNSKKILKDSRTYPHSAKLLLLNEVGILDVSTYRVFDWLRRLRNRAAHEPLFQLGKEDFANIKIDGANDPLNNFYQFCILLIGGFWNEHNEVLGPLFAPGALGLRENLNQ